MRINEGKDKLIATRNINIGNNYKAVEEYSRALLWTALTELTEEITKFFLARNGVRSETTDRHL